MLRSACRAVRRRRRGYVRGVLRAGRNFASRRVKKNLKVMGKWRARVSREGSQFVYAQHVIEPSSKFKNLCGKPTVSARIRSFYLQTTTLLETKLFRFCRHFPSKFSF